MKPNNRWLMVLMGMLLPCFGLAQGNEEPPVDMAAMMAHMSPGDSHAVLAKLEGKWDYVMSMWMEPGAPPQKIPGTSQFEMVLGGRFLKQTLKGDFMGMPLTGIGFTGYDNTRKIYTGIWMDSSGTSLTYGEGSYDAEKQILHIKGKMTEPMTSSVVPYRYTWEIKDDDHMVFSMYTTMAGQEVRMFEIAYTRSS